MTTFRRGVPAVSDRFLTHAIIWLSAILVLGVAAFSVYYMYDRRSPSVGTPFDQALTNAEEMVRLNPENLDTRLGLAGVYFDRHDYAHAAEHYRAALAIDDKSLIAYAGLGRSLAELGDWAGANPNFNTVVAATKDSDVRGDLLGLAYYYLGRGALESRDYDGAITQLKLAVDQNGADADAMMLLGTALVAKGSYAEAIAPLQRATSFVPDFTEAYEQLAIAYERTGATAQARYAAAMKLYAGGNLKKAESELRAVVQANPAFADAWVGLGFVLEREGKKPDAITAYREALTIDNTSFNARQGLVRLGALADNSGGAHGAAGPTGMSGTESEQKGATP